MTGSPSSQASVQSRRRFLGNIARAVGGAGAFSLVIGLFARQAQSLPAVALRPPGALAEADFLSACVRCGLCVRDCPYPTLGLADAAEDVPVGTPYFIARRYPCEMCDDVPCVKACPTGALDPNLTNIDDADMGLAVLVDEETCLNFQGLRCDVCQRVCPLINEAITLERLHNVRTGAHAIFIPTVHSDKCTGCGKCERSCVLEKAAIRVFPRYLAKGRIGEHYRLGWEEKEKRGESFTPGLIDMPDRLPEGSTIKPRGPG
ncbi:ferredoxin-type protein NapG [Pseudomonadota bacterium]